MSIIEDEITEILLKEGGSKVTNDPNDSGGRTQFGIAESSNPGAWADGKVTEAEAREIYFNKYVKGPGFDLIENPSLQAHLVDYGVNSGPSIAIKKLQGVLGLMNDEIDGILGPVTLNLIHLYPNQKDLNNKLMGSRIRMICQIVKKNPSQLTFLNGWIERALSFLK